MKRSSTLFLKTTIYLVGILVTIGMIRFPLTEGRAVNLDLLSIYSDPLILFIYISSTPFFAGLYQAIKLLNLIEVNRAFSTAGVNTLKNMKLASISLIGLIATALVYLRFVAKGEDLAGPTMLGICLALAFSVVATAAGVFQQLLQHAVDIKSENDLTV